MDRLVIRGIIVTAGPFKVLSLRRGKRGHALLGDLIEKNIDGFLRLYSGVYRIALFTQTERPEQLRDIPG